MPGGEFIVSRHAREEMQRRGIEPAAVEEVLRQPEQIVPGHGELRVLQSRMAAASKQFLLRVVVNDPVDLVVVVTVYRTSKIAKYWRSE
ncbi:DUF4258 domain-containing protein [soil metagenome]